MTDTCKNCSGQREEEGLQPLALKKLPGTTMKKGLDVFACPVCDAPDVKKA